MVNEQTKNLADEIMACYEEAYNYYSPIVDIIINNKIENIKLIENTLNHIIYIYTEKGFDLFMKLLLYYGSFNVEATYKYVDKAKIQRYSDYNAYIKKLEKIK